jgi:regulatory protein
VRTSDPFEKAKAYAFLLLKYRQRSRQELAVRMARKKFDPQLIEKTLLFLEEKGFIDDALFTRAWAGERLKKNLGIRRLRNELALKGIAKAVIERELGAVTRSYDETAVVNGLVEEKLLKLKSLDPQKARGRIYGYLIRKGFSPDTIMDALNRSLR